MGIEEVSMRKIAHSKDSTVVTATANQSENVGTVDFSQAKAIGNYAQNSKSNLFLREYLYGKMAQEGVEMPKGMSINISSPENYSEEFKNLLRAVRVDIYGARVLDMFNLLIKDKSFVEQRVEQMQIPDADKAKILQLKAMYDDYYRVEADYNGQKFNLLDLDAENINTLATISPDFANFVVKEKDMLKKHAIDFARGEIEAVELSEAGESSREFIPTLLTVLGLSGAWGVGTSVYDSIKAKRNYGEFMREQRMLKHQKIKFVNPLPSVVGKIKACKNKWMIPLALAGTIGATLIGSIDDLTGCAKDYKQDKDNFKNPTAAVIAGLSAFWGVATSFFVAETVDGNMAVSRAKKAVQKDFLTRMKKAGKMDRVNSLRKAFAPSKWTRFKQMGRYGLVAGGLGVLIAACSSGSSWASMAGTRYLFGKNGDDLQAKNIITKEENTFSAANDNMMKYEAYKGKWRGIAVGPTSDPVIGGTFGATGLLSHANPYVASVAFSLQGCSETLTACGYQLLGNTVRESALDKQKLELVNSVSDNSNNIFVSNEIETEEEIAQSA